MPASRPVAITMDMLSTMISDLAALLLCSLSFLLMSCVGLEEDAPVPFEPDPALLDDLRLDQVQIIGTHNSFKMEADDGIDEVMFQTGYREDHRFGADELKYRLAYGHPPLAGR
jgi:hypothetical protein